MFDKVLVANRGAVAARVVRTLRRLGVDSACVYSDADANSPYLAEASEAHHIGPGPATESYLNRHRIAQLAHEIGADAVHPGYGFLSEDTTFADMIERHGITFIGPRPRLISMMAHKTEARDLMGAHGAPINRGSSVVPTDADGIHELAAQIGYPLLVKPASGGGGIGMAVCHDSSEVVPAVRRATSLAERGFSNGDIYFERFLPRARHIEFQMLGDRHGSVAHLFERDCSVQRRHQKVIEEAGAPNLDRAELDTVAGQLAGTLSELGYDNVGTIEMLYTPDSGFSFLEMNTRLQVEHGVTEEITAIDLVEAQLRLARGERLDAVLPADRRRNGRAIQARVYAEDPVRFRPSPGRLKRFRPPADVRVETGYAEGGEVSRYYDPMLAKVIVHRPTREQARQDLVQALEEFEIAGVKHNVPALIRILESDTFRAGEAHTAMLEDGSVRLDDGAGADRTRITEQT